MNCRTIRRKDIIEDYLAHRLGEALADEFETHLLGCSRCSTLLENMQSLRDGLEERASSLRKARLKESGFLAPVMRREEGSRRPAAKESLFSMSESNIAASRGLIRGSEVAQDWMFHNKEDLRLSGWFEIAGFLGCSPRQVQSWEQSEGFPVRRHLSGKLVSVYASGKEIDAWLTRRGFDPKKNRLDEWLKRRGRILSRGTNTFDAALRMWTALRERHSRFPQEEATTEEKTKKPSEQ